MRNATRIAFTALAVQIALVNGVASATEKFNVTPSVQQTLESAMQESSAFLKAINLIGVEEQSGEALLVGVNGPVASRTNTAGGNRRNPADVVPAGQGQLHLQANQLRHRVPLRPARRLGQVPDFQVRLTDAIIERQALDRIMIGLQRHQCCRGNQPRHLPAAARRQHRLAAEDPYRCR